MKIRHFALFILVLFSGALCAQEHFYMRCDQLYAEFPYTGPIPPSGTCTGPGTKTQLWAVEREVGYCVTGPDDYGNNDCPHPAVTIDRGERKIKVFLYDYPNVYMQNQEYKVMAKTFHLNGFPPCEWDYHLDLHFFRITRENPSVNPGLYMAQPGSVIKGNNLVLNWGITQYSSIESVTLYLDGNSYGNYNVSGSENTTTIPTGSLTPGYHTFRIAGTNACNYTFQSNIITVEVLPTCANNSLAEITANSFLWNAPGSSFEIIEGGYPNGGYKVSNGGQYGPKYIGITNLAQNYEFVTDAGEDLVFQNMVDGVAVYKVESEIGSYEISLNRKSGIDPLGRCPVPPPFKLFVGGNDIYFKEYCSIVLPEYFYTPVSRIPGVTGPGDIIFRHFEYRVESASEVIVKPGITLMEGAELSVVYAPKEITSSDPDYYRNFTEIEVYDDYGNVVASGRGYFDDLSRSTQYQYKNIASGAVIAGQQLYDRTGKPALTTLPAPVFLKTNQYDRCGNIARQWENIDYSYKTNFIATSSGAYNYENFDLAKINLPDALSQSEPGTLGWYYSHLNSGGATGFEEPLNPHIQYPFVQNVYASDGSDDLLHTIPPGAVYRNVAGLQHVGENMLEAVPANDVEVLAYNALRLHVFPNEPAPSVPANAYYRQKYVDEHGIESWSLSDKDGNTLIHTVNDQPRVTSYSFYDYANRLVVTISPNGVSTFNGVNYGEIDKTIYEYNALGWLLATEEYDQGRTEHKYRKDGSRRFSQNEEQRLAEPERYNYITYDKQARVVEAGEYSTGNDGISFAGISKAILEDPGPDGGLQGGFRSEVIRVCYDGTNNGLSAPFEQHFVRGKISCIRKEGVSTLWYNYDERGRMVQTTQYIDELDAYFDILYRYNSMGLVKEVAYQAGNPDAYYHYYEYDADGRLKKVYSGITRPIYNNQAEIQNLSSLDLQATYYYYLHGPLKRVELADNSLQGLDYYYTAEGRLKAVNNPRDLTDLKGGFSPDVFAFSLDYYSGDYQKGGSGMSSLSYANADLYNGTIKGMVWNHQDQGQAAYGYTYDNQNRLASAVYGAPDYSGYTLLPAPDNAYKVSSLSYDPNGNILGIRRNGVGGAALHDFVGQYDYCPDNSCPGGLGNRLYSVNGYAQYAYNTIGQITEKTYNGGTAKQIFEYTPGGLVKNVKNISNTYDVVFGYDQAGKRLKKVSYDANGNSAQITWYIRDNAGNPLSVYKQEPGSPVLNQAEIPVYGSGRIGVCYRNSSVYSYSYELSDHLGNVRATIGREKVNGRAQIHTWMDYYPFGEILPGRNQQDNNRYLYQGQFAEKDEETGYTAFELRMYDPVIGRWMGPDPYRQFYSAYIAMGNNPVSGVDPDGGWCFDGSGNQIACPDGYSEFDNADSDWFVFGDEVVLKGKIGLFDGAFGSTFSEYSFLQQVGMVSGRLEGRMFNWVKAGNDLNPLVAASNGVMGFMTGENIYGEPQTVFSSTVNLAGAALPFGIIGRAARSSSNVLLNTSRQLQAKFKHAGDFGVVGNYSKANAGKFSSAINQHINSAGVQTIQGTYRGQSVIHYVNPNTGLNVISSPSGQLISGWKLNPAQLQNVLKHGGL